MATAFVRSASHENVRDLERLRTRLYNMVDGNWQALHTTEVCEVSCQLDKLIVSCMVEMYQKKSFKKKAVP